MMFRRLRTSIVCFMTAWSVIGDQRGSEHGGCFESALNVCFAGSRGGRWDVSGKQSPSGGGPLASAGEACRCTSMKLSSAILSICVKRNCQQEYSSKNETHSHRPSPAFPTDLVGRAALAGLTSRLPLPARAIFRCHPETMAKSAKAECRVSPNPTSTLHYFGST